MAKRDIGEINAGSMADIAFLLLIFFLVTTTMDTDIAIERILPQKNDEEIIDPPVVKDKNVLEVRCNMQDQLLVEGKLIEISELKDITVEFLTNPDKRGDLPTKSLVTEAMCEDAITAYEGQLAADPENFDIKAELKKWNQKLETVRMLGEYMELPDVAIISLQNDNWTSYGMYMQVQNELTAALNELRNGLCEEKFGRKYTELNPVVEEDKAIIRAIRTVFPQRISEAEPRNLGGN